MTEPIPSVARRGLRSVEAAALAGLAYAALTLVATALFLRAPDPGDGDAAIADWFQQSSNQRSLLVALNLLTIGVVAFLWFVAVIRRRVGARENRFFGTVFLGSALLLSGAWLVAGTLSAAPAIAAGQFDTVASSSDVALTQGATVALVSVVATRLEAVFVISTTTVGRLSQAFPRWWIVGGYTLGLILLLIPVPNRFLVWTFPAWVTVTSVVLLVRRRELGSLRPVAPTP